MVKVDILFSYIVAVLVDAYRGDGRFTAVTLCAAVAIYFGTWISHLILLSLLILLLVVQRLVVNILLLTCSRMDLNGRLSSFADGPALRSSSDHLAIGVGATVVGCGGQAFLIAAAVCIRFIAVAGQHAGYGFGQFRTQ